MRDSFIFYRSFYEALSELENEDKLQIYEAISEYSLNQTITELKGVPKAIFTLIKPQIDANLQRYENGKKGGAPVGNSNARKQSKTTKKQPRNNQKQPNVNDNVNDNVNVNENEQDDKENIFEFLEKNFGRPISPIEFEKIIEWEKHFSEDIIKHAISECCLNDVKTMNYLTTILQDWKSQGFTKLSEVENRKKNNKEEKQQKRVYL